MVKLKYVGLVVTADVLTHTHTPGGIIVALNDVTFVPDVVLVRLLPDVTRAVAPDSLLTDVLYQTL